MNAPAQRKAIIAMSGGVDSSVAALLCQRQGFDCMGVTLKLYDNQDAGLGEASFPGEKTCCSVDDVADARSVAFRLGMPFYVFNFKEAFRREVMDRFAAAYQQGKPPTPVWTATGISSLRSSCAGGRRSATPMWPQATTPGWNGMKPRAAGC